MNNRFIPHGSTKVIDEEGNIYQSLTSLSKILGVNRKKISSHIRKDGYFYHKDKKYYFYSDKVNEEPSVDIIIDKSEIEDYNNFKKLKSIKMLPFETYDFTYNVTEKGGRYAIALFSDAHIEETVKPETVLGLNEYNLQIAEKRIQTYFENLAHCLNADEVDDLIFAVLGDIISGYIHEELAQCNSLTPIEATLKAQSLIFCGLQFLCNNTKLKSIKFIGIVGNHSRTTKKIQHSNGYVLSYEWLMYKNIEAQCKFANLPIEFCLPESELAVINTFDNKRFIFCHGYQIKSSGSNTVCGIYPALNRLSLKWAKTFNQDKIYLGHFHQCVSINNAVVNGSIIGYNAYSLSNGFSFENPAQIYEVYDSNIGLLLTRKIYCS